jgi:hypothetical protein
MTTSQVKANFGTRVVTTISVTSGSPTLTDSANGFTSADVGKSVTTANVAGGTVINSITDAGHAVMSANATGSSGPQSCTLTPQFANIALNGWGMATKANAILAQLPPQQVGSALRAMNEWHNAAGLGQHGLNAAADAAAVGLLLQDV